MVLGSTSGRAVIARPITQIGGKVADKKVTKQTRPRHLREDRVRVCGRWQKKGYEPDDEEVAAWKQRCKDRDLDPKTGKANEKKTPAKKQ